MRARARLGLENKNEREPRLYSYVVTHDTGFAPNPFHGYCTLACCKPVIRRTAREDDWVVGLTSRSERIVYAMRVGKTIDFKEYWSLFEEKRSNWTRGDTKAKNGDNIYEPLPDGRFRQRRSQHRKGEAENAKTRARDLSGEKVLVATEFVYFGAEGPSVEANELGFLAIGRGHRCQFTPEERQTFLDWISSQPRYVRNRPARWPRGDETWRDDR